MNTRVSSAERIQISHRAEKEILRYRDDHAMWHKHVHGVQVGAGGGGTDGQLRDLPVREVLIVWYRR